MKKRQKIALTLSILLLASIACQALFPKTITPGSLEEQVAEGGMRFSGSGNVTYIGCQDPTARVSLSIGIKTRELKGVKFNTDVNFVNLSVLTDGSMVKGVNGCEKSNTEDKHEWGAEGIYYANEGIIRLTGCGAQNRHRAEGNLYLVGEGFEGEYTCYDADDDGLMYSVAISAYEIGE